MTAPAPAPADESFPFDDFAHTAAARANRLVKATRLARVLWEVDDPRQLAEPALRRRLERQAGVRRCSDETWRMAVDIHREERTGR